MGNGGWTIEFFIELFYIVVDDMLEVFEKYRDQGYVSRSLNSTFIDLIPKNTKPKSFNDFKPTCLCNLIYKIIVEFISNIINPKLSEFM